MDFIPRTTRRNLLQTLDGPCSALALNCCQLSCCIPRDALSRYYDDDDEIADTTFAQHADWMQQVLTACPTLTLRDLVLPGTHDSGSYSIPWTSLFSAAGRTQNLSVLQQLQRGARYLDLRVGGGSKKDDNSSIWHGCLVGDAFQRVMDQVATFLHDHAGEFVIIEVVAEYGRPFTPTQKIQCLSVLQETLGDKIYKHPDDNSNDLTALFQQSSLIDVIHQQKKQCLILLHGRFYEGLEDNEINGITYNEDYIATHYGYFRSDHWMNNRWYNTRDISKLLQWNLEEVQQQNGNNNRDQLLQNQFILTPGVGSPTDILRLLFGGLSLRPVSFALLLYQGNLLEDYVRQNAKQPWNMIMLDFIDLVPGLVAFLISLNYNSTKTSSSSSSSTSSAGYKLQIQLAAAHDGKEGSSSINVTDKIQAYLPREAVLYVTNVAKDLGLSFSTGTLTLVYRFSGGSNDNSSSNNNNNNTGTWQVKQVKFDANTQVLLSLYAANPGPTVAIGDDAGNDQNENSGVVFQGQRHASGDKTPTNCTVVQYTTHGNDQEPEFTLVN